MHENNQFPIWDPRHWDFGITERLWGPDNPNVTLTPGQGTSNSSFAGTPAGQVMGATTTQNPNTQSQAITGSGSSLDKIQQGFVQQQTPDNGGGGGGGGGQRSLEDQFNDIYNKTAYQGWGRAEAWADFKATGGPSSGGNSGGNGQDDGYKALLDLLKTQLDENIGLAKRKRGEADTNYASRLGSIAQDYSTSEGEQNQNMLTTEAANRASARASGRLGSSVYDLAQTNNRDTLNRNVGALEQTRMGDIGTADTYKQQAYDNADAIENSAVGQYGMDANSANQAYQSKLAQIDAANQMLTASGISNPNMLSYKNFATSSPSSSTDQSGNPVTDPTIMANIERLKKAGYLNPGYTT